MSGDVWTWIIAFLIGLGVVSLMAISVICLFRAFRTIKAEFYCPWVRRNVTVRYLTHDGRRPVGVISCTAFADSTGVICGMPCLVSDGQLGVREEQKDPGLSAVRN